MKPISLDWTTELNVTNAITAYGDALLELKKLQQDNLNLLPDGNVSVGTIGEYYAFIWLKHSNPTAIVKYGRSTEKSWDISVEEDNKKTFYQVKTVSLNSQKLTIKNLIKGFDKLIVIVLAEDYFPEDVYLLDSNFEFKSKSFAVPHKQKGHGSKIFKTNAKNIHNGFFTSLADTL